MEVVSALRLGELLGATPTQIRKDLSYFGLLIFFLEATLQEVQVLQGQSSPDGDTA